MTSRDRAPVIWTVAAATALVVGLLVRWLLLPAKGLEGDIDVFVRHTHDIAVNGLGNAYDGSLPFPPVMTYIWAILAAIEPAFKVVSDSSDPAIRSLMKVPATLADIGLALVVGYALRRTPLVAILAAAAIFLHPAVIDVSAWWGQYESIYLLSGLIAVVCAINQRNGLAAAFLAVSIMTKPQALPILVPFAAWFWATGGVRGFVRASLIGVAVIVVLWLPFVPSGGPLNYLRNLNEYQGQVFNILSLRAWNLWWIVESLYAGGQYVPDDQRVAGPLTFRHVGFALTGVLELLVFVVVKRDPRPRTLILGCAAATLVAFSFLTTMHERYAFAAIGFLMLLVAEARLRWLAITFGIVFTLNLFSAVPPAPEIHAVLDYVGPVTVLGSIAMLVITALTILALTDRGSSPARTDDLDPSAIWTTPDVQPVVEPGRITSTASETGRRRRCDTSAGNGAATSEA